jgi:hypothetical protein
MSYFLLFLLGGAIGLVGGYRLGSGRWLPFSISRG